jgi:hypothetical protein
MSTFSKNFEFCFAETLIGSNPKTVYNTAWKRNEIYIYS